jgi:DNA-directed RNA polymerase subunit alpha
LSRLVVPKIECVESRGNFGRFLAAPLEKGFGVTLGNSLRRVLLSYLPGAAVTRIRIEGILHEFSAIPNVKEDVTEFTLNVKELRLVPVSGEPGKLVLDVSKPGQIRAGDIKGSTDFEIANPELYLATLDSDDSRLYVEFDVELGAGFQPAGFGGELPIGTISVDAIFSPVRKVNFTVEPIYAGQESSQEQMVMEIWTDGSTSPLEAMSRSAQILVDQLTPFVSCAQVETATEEEQRVRLSVPEDIYNMPVDRLDLSVRTMNCLRRGGIETVGQILSKGEKGLLSLRNFGQKSKQEIEDRLKELGLSLAPMKEEEVAAISEEGTEDET